MEKVILLKYGEMVLKGLNRSYFNARLEKRIKQLLSMVKAESGGGFYLDYMQSTLYIHGTDGFDMEAAFVKMQKVFGVVSVCLAYETEKDMDKIKSVVKEYLPELVGNAKTFKCNAKRSDKKFPLGSPEICNEIGGLILSTNHKMKVDIHNPEVTIVVEIREKNAYVHNGGVKGAGGMPIGSNGKGLLLLSGGIDSPVAGYMVAKRGVCIDCVYFESPPYTSEMALQKVETLAKKLSEYCGNMYMHAVPTTEIQEQIAEKCDERYSTVILRRFMVRLAQKLAKTFNAEILINGESIGQVASQTLPAINATNVVAEIPIIRPCIGLDKDEIVTIARKIDTFETSILPYEDCCTVFTPKHPNTRPRIEDIEAEEAKLDVEGLVERALAGEKVIKIKCGEDF